VDVPEEEVVLPSDYILYQNYPNPFNPTTTFRYSIPQTSKVVIKVYDILGNEVATLMDEEKSVGTYELTWNAASLSNGIYFYQLKAGDYVSTKKMILLK
jgi:flagellar hook assembly protein FlgD